VTIPVGPCNKEELQSFLTHWYISNGNLYFPLEEIEAWAKDLAAWSRDNDDFSLVQLIKAFESERAWDAFANAVRPDKRTTTPILDQLGRNLTRLAENEQLSPVIGRDREIHQMARILRRKNKNNPLLTGRAGVGKTALVEGLAQLLVSSKCPNSLKGMTIVELSMADLVAGTRYRGDFEERLQGVVEELKKSQQIILFIDEIHTMLGAGAASGGALDAANILKPALARGEIRCIGATTEDEYNQYISRDPALQRRFLTLHVAEPSPQYTLEILQGLYDRYEKHHGLQIDDVVLTAIVELADRYLPDRQFPDKAIDLLDEACTLAAFPSTPEMRDARPRLDIDTICQVVEEWTGQPVDHPGRA